jgi:hypothetical protein
MTYRATLAAAILLSMALPAAAVEDEELEQRVAAQAAELPVAIEVKLGLAAKTPRRGFLQVQVDLTSRDEAREVRVVLRTPDGDTPLLELESVSLEPQAIRRVRGLAPARMLNDTAAILVEAFTGDTRVGVALAYPDPSYDRVLLVLDQRGTPPTDLSKLRSRRTVRAGVREDPWLTASISSTDELPDSPLAYTGVNAVLLGDLPTERWTAAQAGALAGWVARGGHIYISLGQRAAGLRKGQLGLAFGAAFDPIPTDHHPIPGSEVTLGKALSAFGDPAELTTLHPPTLTRLSPGPDDEIVLRDDASPGRPFAVHRRHGAGRVTLIACDLWAPPFLHAAHTRRLIEALLDPKVRYRPRAAWLFPKLAEIRQPTQIGPAFALLILFALIAGPGVYFLLRAKKRGILLWLAIPGLTIMFSALVPLYRLALRKAESTLVGVRLIEGRVGDAVGVETIDALLFSGSLGEKVLELQGQDAAAYAVVPPRRFLRGKRSGKPSQGAVLGSAGSGGRLRCELPVALWGARYVSCERTHKVKVSQGSVGLGSGSRTGVDVDLTYEGYLALKDPVLLIPLHDSVQLHVLPRDLTPGDRYTTPKAEIIGPGAFEPRHEGLAAILSEWLIANSLSREAMNRRKAFLIGHTDEPTPLIARPNVRVRAFATIVVLEMPVRYRSGVPWGALQPRVETTTVAHIGSAQVERHRTTHFQLPVEAQGEPVQQVALRLTASRWATLRGVQLQGLKASTGKFEPIDLRLARRTENSVRLDLRLESPREWVNAKGQIVLREVFTRPVRAEDRSFCARIFVAVDWGEPSQPAPQEPPEPPEPPDGAPPR